MLPNNDFWRIVYAFLYILTTHRLRMALKGNMGSFIKDVINQGGGGFAKRWFNLISLFSKNDDEGGGSQKFRKIDDVFYERPQSVAIGRTAADAK